MAKWHRITNNRGEDNHYMCDAYVIVCGPDNMYRLHAPCIAADSDLAKLQAYAERLMEERAPLRKPKVD
jgi:hypothetical protein